MYIFIALIIVIILLFIMVGILCFICGEAKGWKEGINHYKEYLQAISDIDSN